MSTPPRKASDLFKHVTEILAGLASAVAFVYLVGAGVLWIRLYQSGLPAEAVITSLPRELLLSVGLRTIFLPALAFAVLAGFVLLLLAPATSADDRGSPGRTRTTAADLAYPEPDIRIGITILTLLFTTWLSLVAVVALGGFALLWWIGPGFMWALAWTVGALCVILISAVIASRSGPQRASLRAIALIAALVGIVATLVRLGVESYSPQFENATVCVRDGAPLYTGLFIGETSNGVYLGQKDDNRVIEVPRDRLSELWIGASTATCGTLSGSETSKPMGSDEGNARDARRAAADARSAADHASATATVAKEAAADARQAAELAGESATASATHAREAKTAAAEATGAATEAKGWAQAVDRERPPRWPVDAQRLANGLVSIPVSSVRPPAHLTITDVSFSPNPLRSHRPVLATLRVRDTRGFVVRDALVSVLGLRETHFRAADKWTNLEGIVEVALYPTRKLALRRPRHVVLMLRARDPADGLLAGVSTRRLVRFSVANP